MGACVLRRVHHGDYAMGGAVLPREGRWLAAVLASGDGSVLSHVSAAVHWNLLQYDAPRPEVTAPASRRRVPGIRLHRSRCLDAQDTTHHHGNRVLRFTWRQLRDDPHTVAERLEAVMRPDPAPQP